MSLNHTRNLLRACTLALAASLTPSLPAYPLQTLTTNVQPLNGTDNDGDEFPGAVVPFGMVQWSPDTISQDHSGGYFYPDTQITGFGLDHLSGAGCTYGGDFAFTPILGSLIVSPANGGHFGRTAHASAFSHANEIAAPGYYSVVFTNGIRTELTVTTRTGFGRFTFPAGNAATVLINASSGASGTRTASIQIDPGAREISGWTTQNGFCGSGQTVTLYFVAVFDHPFTRFGVWNGGDLSAGGSLATGTEAGSYLEFNLPNGGAVLAHTALSYVSVANARANLQAESPADSLTNPGFDAAVDAASNVWNGYLNKIQLTGGTVADRQTFYTMMYHAFQAPSVVSDVNGQYIGFDNLIHTATNFTKYEFFSGWDIYRSECQFLAIMDPAAASGMAQSLVQDAREGGAMPRWSVPSGDTGVMMGDPATPIIAGMYAFGATNFDSAAALQAMVKAALDPATVALNRVHERDAERDYLNLGFVPADERGGYGPVSMTLEYCSADFALARFAQALGDATNSLLAMNRAQNWRNHLNPDSGYLQMRDSDFHWSPGFPAYQGRAYVEGTAFQYFWMVPFNLRSLADLIGGPQAACDRLDAFFSQLNDADTSSSHFAYMGNEPCSETPWIYSFLGRPYRTSGLVRQCVTQLFSTAPTGLPGNDDLGQMASWYVFSALGLYPEIPGDNVLVLNGPLFPQAVVHLPNGDLTINGGAGDDAPYVQSLSVNGHPSNFPWLRFTDIAHGGTLDFAMSSTPNTNWGADIAVAPPSYMDGMTTPFAPTCVWGTGLEANDPALSATNTVDADAPGGGISHVDSILDGGAGPELAVRTENAQSGGNSLMYSGKASGAETDFAYLKAFDLTAQNITVSPGLRLSYWVFPQSEKVNSLVTGSNSAYVALDLIFADGTRLRDSGLTDQHGVRLHPTEQGGILAFDSWNFVSVDLTPLAGKTISRIDFVYDNPGSSGGYRGYVDDLALTTPFSWFTNNVALNKPALADSQQPGHPASNGNDGRASTAWLTADQNPNHWWQVDLGRVFNLTADEVIWPVNGALYDYEVAASLDGTHWTTVASKTANPSTAQNQSDLFVAPGRYVRLTLTGVPAGQPAGFSEFRVFGSKISVPVAPAAVQACGGYGLASLNWSPVPGATSYNLKRASRSGAETTIATVSGTNYTDFGLASGATYFYVVSAENLLGASANSSEVSATAAAPAPGSYEAALLAHHPLAYWPLTETTGSTAFDWVGGFSGAYVGGVAVGRTGVSLKGFASPNRAPVFDGSTGYVDVPAAAQFNLTNAVTLIAWVNAPAAPNHFGGVLGHGDRSWRLTVDNSGNPGAADGGNGDASAPSSLATTGWHMLTYTYSGVPDAANNGTLFVDGRPVAYNTVGSLSGGGSDVFIGGSPDYGTDRLFAGGVAHAAIFTNALTPSQILALYQAATNGK